MQIGSNVDVGKPAAVTPNSPSFDLADKLPSNPSTQKTSPPKITSPFYAVVVESSDQKQRKLLGTALAIDKHRLLTLASIVEAAKQVESNYPTLRLYSPGTDMAGFTPTMTMTKVHPKFSDALAGLKQFEKELDKKLSEVKELKEPTVDERLEWSTRYESFMSEIVRTNFVCLMVTKHDIPVSIPLSNARSISDKNVLDCKLIGFPTFIPSPDVVAGQEAGKGLDSFFVEGKAQLKREQTPEKTSQFVETTAFEGLPLVSMVCVAENSSVLGFCIQPVPSESVTDLQRCEIALPEEFWK